MSGEGDTGRRDFLRELFRRAAGPVADRLDGGAEAQAEPELRSPLRPPGALAEVAFLATCERCLACVEACPADAILPLEAADERLRNTPVIIPSRKACVICEDLACMPACPSGALVSVQATAIRMGLARVDHDRCVRSAGETCTRCVDLCPLGPEAIALVADRVEVLEGCVGCGVCENVCPTSPRAVVVQPRSDLG